MKNCSEKSAVPEIMAFNPFKHHRRSIHLKGYDYSQAGLYFITICCHHRACLYGAIENGIMNLNDAGVMVDKWYYELENKYPDKRCHEMIVMPNHFHCIIENIPIVSPITDAPMDAPTEKNTTSIIKNISQPLAMQWIGLKQ